MTSSLKLAVQQIGRAGDEIKRVGAQIREAGTAMTAAITLPLVGAAGAATKFSADFQTQMTKIVNLSGVSEEQMQKMRKAVLDLAPTVGIGPRALADALLVVTSTGIRGAEALEILEMAAKASAVGLGDTKDIARALTSAMTAYGVENLSAARASEVLFKTVREGGAEANELAGVLGRIVGIASQVGVSFDQVGAFLATFTRLGVDSAEATTALRGVLSTLLKPSADARDQLRALGTSVDELRLSVKEKGLTQAMIDLVGLTKGNEDALAAIIPNVRALAGVMGTAGAQGKAMADVQKVIAAETDDLGEAFRRQQATAAATWNEVTARVERAAIAFGDALAPYAMKAMDALRPLIGIVERGVAWFGQLPGPVQATAVGLGLMAAAAGPALFVVGQLAAAIGSIIGLVGTLGAAFPTLGASFAAAAGPIGLVALAITGLVGAVAVFQSRMSDLEQQGKGPKYFDENAKKMAETAQKARELAAAQGPLVDGTRLVIKSFADAAAATNASKTTAQLHTEATKALRAEQAQVAKDVASLTAADRAAIAAAAALGKQQSDLATAYKVSEGAIKKVVDADKKHAETMKDKARETKKALEDIREMEAALPQLSQTVGVLNDQELVSIARWLELNKALQQNEQHWRAVNFGMQGVLDGIENVGQKVPVLSEEQEKAIKSGDRWNNSLTSLSTSLNQLAQITGSNFVKAIAQAVGAIQLGKESTITWHKALVDMDEGNTSRTEGYAKIAASIMGMVAAMDQATSSGGKMARTISGALTGAQIGAQVGGPIGAAVGAIGGALLGFFRGQAVEKEVNRIREAYVQAAGGLATLSASAFNATGSLALVQQLLNARTPEQYKAAIDKLNEAFAAQHQAMQTLDQTVKKYGFSLEELGPALQRSELDKKAQELYQDFKILQAGGIDVDAIVRRMAESTNAYVQQAVKMGFEIPSAMRPMLERMREMGLLTDSAGNRIEDFESAGIKFAETMSEGFSRVVSAVEKLAQAIARTLGVALDDVAHSADEAGRAIDKLPRGGKFLAGDDAGGGVGVVRMASGGSGTVASPTSFLAEEGSEDFAFSGGGRSFGQSGGDSAVVRLLTAIQSEMVLQRNLWPVAIKDALAGR